VWSSHIATTGDARWRSLASDVYGYVRYNCPTLNITSTYALNNTASTWQYRWNVGTASHVGELLPIWNNATSAAGVFAQAYWASFIRSYDPNTHAVEYLLNTGSKLESPDWHVINASDGQRLGFNDNNVVGMEDVREEEWNKCDVIDSMGLYLKQ
jgi:hypothetical protein